MEVIVLILISNSNIKINTGIENFLCSYCGPFHGKTSFERTACAGAAACSQEAVMAFDDAAADGEAHARARIITVRMKALEGREYPLQMSFLEADAVIFDFDNAVRSLGSGPNCDGWRLVVSMELQCISDQILEKQTYLEWIGFYRTQVPYFDSAVGLFDSEVQV
jgi:hypothetical protein